MSKLVKRVSDKIEYIQNIYQYRKISQNVDFQPTSQFIISGDPRGGTTWLAEIIQSIPKTSLIWEPLWLSREKTFRNHNFSYRQFIPEDAYEPKIKESFEKLLSGKILNNNLCQFTSPEELKNTQHLLVKFCRANQLLPWLTKNFSFEFTPIYIVRHPCAVIASQLRQGGWDQVSSQFHIPYDKPYPEFYRKHELFLLSLDSKVKVLAANWCICNAVPLNHPENNKKWITLTYESLVLDGHRQLERIEKRWGLKLPDLAFSKLTKASATTVKGSPVLDGQGSQLNYWKTQLSESQIQEILEVLDYFKVELYNDTYLPKYIFK